MDHQAEPINFRNLKKAIQLAERGGVTNVLITGKGEPTLYPEHVTAYMNHLVDRFPFIELQTNGSILEMDRYQRFSVPGLLEQWAGLGMTTVMISNVGYKEDLNQQIYFPRHAEWIDLQKVVDRVHEAGMIVRYTTVGIKGGIDSLVELEWLLRYTSAIGIDQVTWRPVAKTVNGTDSVDTSDWIAQHGMSHAAIECFMSALEQRIAEGHTVPLYDLAHNGRVYDYDGHNVCITNCLTKDHEYDDDELRQLIFFPNGRLYTDWQLKGSRLL